MGNRNQEDEKAMNKRLAGELGISTDELELLTWDIAEINSEDGVMYNYTMVFSEDSPKEILEKIEGLSDKNTYDISMDVPNLERPKKN
jgi:hypothetical protein